MTKSRLGTLVMGLLVIPAVVADVSRPRVGDDSPLVATNSAASALVATAQDEPKSTSKVLEVPSIFVDGREFFVAAHQQIVSEPLYVQRQLAKRTVLVGKTKFPRRLVSQQWTSNMNPIRRVSTHQAATQPLYIVQKEPERSRWRRAVTRLLGGIHARWIAVRAATH